MIFPKDQKKKARTNFDKIIADLYEKYQISLRQNEALDFDDLLLLPLELFDKKPLVLDKYQEKWKYILVDEYQDTNKPQFQFLKRLSNKYKKICVVGDDDQSIYGWRGAEINNILDFKKTFIGCDVFKLEKNKLLSKLKSVSFAQSSDENRYILNGVYFNFSEDNLTLVATDGRRLSLTSHELEGEFKDKGSLILPAKTVSEIERLTGKGEEIKIAFNDRQVAFEIAIEDTDNNNGLIDHIYLVSKIVEGNFPNYRQVIPKETEHRIKVERELFLECVHRAALVTSEKSNSIKLKISKNLMEITGSSAEYGESHESMGISYDGPDVQIGFNPVFLQEPLRALDQDEIFFEFKDELSPGIIKTLDQFLCVIMPLRL